MNNQGQFPFPGNNNPPRPPANRPPTDKFANLNAILYNCNYKKENFNLVGQSAYKVMRQYVDLKCDTLSFADKGVVKTFLEIKGSISVAYKGSNYSININIMLPQNFPQQRPYIRIINPDPSSFEVNPVYKDCQSKHDPTSYLLKDLTTIKCWGTYSSIIGVLEETQVVLGKDFPFKTKAKTSTNPKPTTTGFNSDQFFKSNPSLKPPTGNQPQPKYQSHGTGAGDPTHNVPKQLNPQQLRAKNQINQYNQKNKVLVQQTGRVVTQLLHERAKDFLSIQDLTVIQTILSSQNQNLSTKIKQMQTFVQTNDVDSDFSLKNVVVPSNQDSGLLLNLVCAYKASSESISHIEAMFSNARISLDTFLKLVRKVEEQRFTAKYLMNKLMTKM